LFCFLGYGHKFGQFFFLGFPKGNVFTKGGGGCQPHAPTPNQEDQGLFC